MKYLLFSAFLFLTSFHFKNTSPNIEVTTAISTDKMNVFYIGVDNPVSVAISGVPIEDTKVSIDKGTITPTDTKGHYHVRVFEAGKVTIFLEGIDSRGNRINHSSEFRVKRIPNPTLKSRSISSGRMEISELKSQEGLTALLEKFEYYRDKDVELHILSYTISLAHYQDITEVENQGVTFKGAAKALIQKAKKGDAIYFEDIRVKGPDGTTRKIPTLSFLLY